MAEQTSYNSTDFGSNGTPKPAVRRSQSELFLTATEAIRRAYSNKEDRFSSKNLCIPGGNAVVVVVGLLSFGRPQSLQIKDSRSSLLLAYANY